MSECDNDFQSHIKKILKELNVVDYTLEIAAGSSKGDNFMALIKRVDVYGKNKDGENTELYFVVKKSPENEVFRKAHSTKKAYAREIYVYEKILPSFVDFQQKHNVSTPFDAYPQYYDSSQIDLKEFIILQNMKALGYENCDRQKRVDFNHILLVMKQMGKLHALSFALRRKNFEAFRDIRDNVPDIEFDSDFQPTSKSIMDLLCIFALKTLDPLEDRVAFDKFYSFSKKILNVTKSVIHDVSNSDQAAILHGNCWIGNFLFKYQNEHSPSTVCMLDWQFTKVGSPAFDISQLLFICCDKEVRNYYYSDLLQAYYESFSSFLSLFGEDPNELFPFDALVEHLRKYSVYGFCGALRTLYLASICREDIPDFSQMKDMQEIINRCINAKRDVNSYNKAMRDVILDYINFGYEM